MKDNISIYSNKIFGVTSILAFLFIYLVYYEKNIYLYFFLLINISNIFSFVNGVYLFNIKNSIIDKMNFQNKKIYTKLTLQGVLAYIPIFLVLIGYSLWRYDLFLGVGITITLNILISIILCIFNRSKQYVFIIIFLFSEVLSIVFLFRGIGSIIG